jgi:hypothetical protein
MDPGTGSFLGDAVEWAFKVSDMSGSDEYLKYKNSSCQTAILKTCDANHYKKQTSSIVLPLYYLFLLLLPKPSH